MGITGIDFELGRIDFGKRSDKYLIDTEKYPETNFDENILAIEVHHSVGIIEWNPKVFKMVSAWELFKDTVNLNGSLNHELVLERFKKHNPLNATVLEYVLSHGNYFEEERNLAKNQFKFGSEIGYGGTIYSIKGKLIIRASGMIYDGFWNSSSKAISLEDSKILSETYCPVLG